MSLETDLGAESCSKWRGRCCQFGIISLWGTATSPLCNSCKLHPDWNAVATVDCCKTAHVFPSHQSRVASLMQNPSGGKHKETQDFNVNNECHGSSIPGVPLLLMIKYLTGTRQSRTDKEEYSTSVNDCGNYTASESRSPEKPSAGARAC